MNISQRRLSKQKKSFFTEKFVIVIIMFIFILLIGFNAIRMYNYYITTQLSEFNTIYGPKADPSSQEAIEIAIEGDETYPLLEIIVNGESLDYKFEKNNRIILTVHDGDVIQINSSMYSDDIRVEIKNMPPNISNVLNNNHIILKGNMDTLAIIKI